jgi:hypothetical protein
LRLGDEGGKLKKKHWESKEIIKNQKITGKTSVAEAIGSGDYDIFECLDPDPL